jgi:hypothetical protein
MHAERDPFRVYDEDHDDFQEAYGDEGLFDEFDCLFPGNCYMPELHFTSECHTTEMAAEFHGHEDDPAAPDETEAARVEATRHG